MSARSTRCLRILTVACLFLLPACSTALGLLAGTVVGRAPPNLRQPCPPLLALPTTPPPLLGDLIDQMAADAGQYAECARTVEGWIRWERGALGGWRRVLAPDDVAGRDALFPALRVVPVTPVVRKSGCSLFGG